MLMDVDSAGYEASPSASQGNGAAASMQVDTGASSSSEAPVLTGVAGMEIINDMFQRQARRVESQLHQQANDRKMIELSQAQLLFMQSQLVWHAQNHHERLDQVTKSAEAIAQMESYVKSMSAEQASAVQTCRELADRVGALRDKTAAVEPQKMDVLSTSLSDIARGTDLAKLPGIGDLFSDRKETEPNASSSTSSNDPQPYNELMTDASHKGASQHSPLYSRSCSSHRDGSSDPEHNDNSCSDSADASAASTNDAMAPKRAVRESNGASKRHQLGRFEHKSPVPDADNELRLSSDSTSQSSDSAGNSQQQQSEGGAPWGRAHPAHAQIAPAGLQSYQMQQNLMRAGMVRPAPVGAPGVEGIQQGLLTHPTPSALAQRAALGLGLLDASGATSSHPHVIQPTNVVQGVIPYPGQGLIDIQQGVIGSVLEPFASSDKKALMRQQQAAQAQAAQQANHQAQQAQQTQRALAILQMQQAQFVATAAHGHAREAEGEGMGIDERARLKPGLAQLAPAPSPPPLGFPPRLPNAFAGGGCVGWPPSSAGGLRSSPPAEPTVHAHQLQPRAGSSDEDRSAEEGWSTS